MTKRPKKIRLINCIEKNILFWKEITHQYIVYQIDCFDFFFKGERVF